MKKILIKAIVFLMTLTLSSMPSSVMAKKIPLQKVGIPSGNEEENIPHRVPAVIPGVDYTDNVLTFFSNVQILSMEVIVKDSNGNVIYNDYISITNGETAVELPDEVNANAWTVDIIYGSMHLSGYLY